MLVVFLIIALVHFNSCNGIHLDESYSILNSRSKISNKLETFLKQDDSGKFSLQCKFDLLQYARSLLSGKIEDMWAKFMFDAASKIPSGLLEIATGDLGSFDECLKVEATTARYEILGKYCLGIIPISFSQFEDKKHLFQPNTPNNRGPNADGNIGFQMATCLPHSCTAAEIQSLYSDIGFGMLFSEDQCQTKSTANPKLDAGSIATILFLSVILLIMLASTAYDVVLRYLNKKPCHPTAIAFSLVTNTKKILTVHNESSQITCLHGIRVLSTMWIIFGHKYMTQATIPMKNNIDISKWLVESEGSMVLLGSTVSVDTFFLMGGIVISYTYMIAVHKKVKFNVLVYYFHRYIRLTPVLAVIILIHVTLFKYFGSGPLWPQFGHGTLVTDCETDWWRTLLYIQTYGDVGMCISQSWYLSVDMQLFLLSPLLLIPLKRWPKFTLIATTLLTACSMLACFLSAWFLNLVNNPFVVADPVARRNYFKNYYYTVHTRAAPWLMGIFLGYIIFTLKQRKSMLIINKLIIVAAWAASVTILCTCVFAGHDLVLNEVFGEHDKVAISFHLALVRPAWAAAVGFVIFACTTGNGGPVNWFLSLPMFQVTSKLTYTMYLSHMAVISYISGQIRDAERVSNGYMMYIFWGDFMLTLAVSFVLTLAFESPIITIERVLLGGNKKKEAAPIKSEEIKTEPV